MATSATKVKTIGTQAASGQSLALHVVKGVHTDALTPLAASSMLLIGSSDDCDVILSDAGVVKHHCILSAHSDGITVRPLGASVTLHGQRHEPGNGVQLLSGVQVELGGAAFEVIAHNFELADTNGALHHASLPLQGSAAREDRMRHPFHRSRWVIGLVLLAAAAFELQPMILTARSHSTESEEAAAKSAIVAGRQRSGSAVAQDVAEVLRLSGISVDAVYDGNGTVKVSGHLGDPANVAAIVQSRAMHEIAGLQRVVVVNLDEPNPPAPAPASAPAAAPLRDPTRIILALGGNNPYVVTADGSRYHVGETLPQGGRLRGVQNGAVLVERSGHIVRLNLLDRGIGG
jgi:Inner membrane component of T3SS, cytoplasmic domain